jgi:hypothetical protein
MTRLNAATFIFAMALAAQTGSPSPTWTDPATGLTWTRKDNGAAVNRDAARSYCESLNLGGLTGWTLPEIDRLKQLYDRNSTSTFALVGMHFDYHIKGHIELTGWHWSTTPVSAEEIAKEMELTKQFGGPVPKVPPNEGWTFDFQVGQQFPIDVQVAWNKRALCVHRP